MGAWIETIHAPPELGLRIVAPFMGAWIETIYLPAHENRLNVAPFMGAWIETDIFMGRSGAGNTSLPSWERGLKRYQEADVTSSFPGRSLHGSVD